MDRQQRRGLRLLNERRRVPGRVVAPDGSPAAGAIVGVVWGTAPTPEIGIVADAEGRFGVGLPAGRFRLQANLDEISGTAEVEIEAGADVPEIVIALDDD